MKNATYLYFYSQNGEISPILLTSIAHYSYFSNRYVLVTNITKEKFPHIFRERIEIIDIADVETSETKSISHEIMMMWDRNILKANCPAVELHCFKRWLILRDLFEHNIFEKNCNIFAHDWDDLLFVPISTLISPIEAMFTSSLDINTSLFVSHTPNPVGQYLIPHFLLCNYKAVEWFKDIMINLAKQYSIHHPTQNFPDMSVWAYMYHFSIAKNIGIAKLWSDVLPSDLFVDDNVRILKPEKTLFDHESVQIPPSFNYLDGDRDMLDIKKYTVEDDSNLYVTCSDGTMLKAINTHYSGVEGKYILMRDTRNKLQPFYKARPELQGLMKSFIPDLN
tara:strand:+ start:6139 stop:7146 length:1008 start_codon:yes stop_codon:yes gene_type:complete